MFSNVISKIGGWIFKNKNTVITAGSDVAQLITLIVAKNYVGAAEFLLTSASNLNTMSVSDIVKEAKSRGVDLNEFIPVLNSLNSKTHVLSQSTNSLAGNEKVYDARILVGMILSRRNLPE